MSLLLAALRAYTPAFLKKRQLADLFECTAAAFGAEPPSTVGHSYDECLLEYARFTAARAEEATQRGDDLEVLRERLYRNAYDLGRDLRRRLRISSDEDAMAAMRYLYRALRVELRGPVEGEFTVERCYFARYYSSGVCQVISALDAGVAAGLTDGGQFTFYQRLTDGHDRCRARLEYLPSGATPVCRVSGVPQQPPVARRGTSPSNPTNGG